MVRWMLHGCRRCGRGGRFLLDASGSGGDRIGIRLLALVVLAVSLPGCPTDTPEDSDQEGTPGGVIEQTAPRLVFASDRGGNYDIYTMKLDGSGVVQLTNTEADEREPAGSPDGLRIAFVRETALPIGPYDFASDVYVMDAVDADADGNGDNLRRLTTFAEVEAAAREPAWSPDGGEIVFAGWMGNWSIHKVDVQSLATTRLTFGSSSDRSPAWTPDGAGIAYERDSEIMTMQPDGTPGQMLVGGSSGYAVEPAWSPFGSQLAYCDFVAILVKDHVTGGTRRVTYQQEGEFDTSPAWSPGAGLLAFVREVSRGAYGGEPRTVMVVQSDGTYPSVQPVGQLGDNIDPDWMPRRTPVYVRNWSQYDVNDVWLVRGGGPGVPVVRERLTRDLSVLVPGGTDYDNEIRVEMSLLHDPSLDPEPTPYEVLEYVQERTFFDGQPLYHDDPLTSLAFAPGIVRVGGYRLVRETIFILDWSVLPAATRHEQLLRGTDGMLYAYRPGGSFAGHASVGPGPILLQTLIDGGYGAYAASQRGP